MKMAPAGNQSKPVGTRGLEPHSQDFQSCAYTMSAKCPFGGSSRIRLDAALSAISSLLEYCRGARSWPEATFEARVGLGSLAESWFLWTFVQSASRLRPLTDASFCLTMQSYDGRLQPICVPKNYFQKYFRRLRNCLIYCAK